MDEIAATCAQTGLKASLVDEPQATEYLAERARAVYQEFDSSGTRELTTQMTGRRHVGHQAKTWQVTTVRRLSQQFWQCQPTGTDEHTVFRVLEGGLEMAVFRRCR